MKTNSPTPDERPLVSIVTPSFNQARYLEQTLRSVLEQTYPNIEYLVMDGGSTDGSAEIIRRHSARLAYWQSTPDRGFADAIQQGFTRSQGQILAYLNSDDLLAPDAVENAVRALQRNPTAVMVYGNRVCIDQNDDFLYLRPNLPFWARTPYSGMVIGQESCFWRREVFTRVGGLNTELRFAIDYDLFSRFAKDGPFVHDGRIWGFFRRHPESKTMTQYVTLGKQENARIQQEVWGRRPPRVAWLAVLFFIRAYAFAGSLVLRTPQWPAGVPLRPRKGLLHRLHASMHETSRLKPWLGRLIQRN